MYLLVFKVWRFIINLFKKLWEAVTQKFRFPIIVEMDEDGYYIVSCPIFKGCHTYGETIEEALENIKEVIEMCLEETNIEELNKFIGYREIEIVRNV